MAGAAAELVPYEVRLNKDRRWALMEGSMHFEKESAVFAAMDRIARRLDGLGVPYAVVGGMAMFVHGYRRFTEDVDLLVTKESLKTVHEQLEGLGYVPPFAGSKHLRDTVQGVKVEFLTTGDYPGDGKPKPVAFPDPADVGQLIDGIRVIRLDSLIELKLASGMSSPHRGKDLVDVQELAVRLALGEDFAEKLNPYVRDKFLEIVRLMKEYEDPHGQG